MTTQAALAAALCLTLAACSGGPSNSRLDYNEVKSAPALDVPPDLTAPANTGLEEIPQVGAGAGPEFIGSGPQVLPRAEGIHIEHEGAERWLRIDAPAAKLWPELREFWSTLGLELVVDQPAIGIMETDWAENHADAPKGFLANMVQKVFKNAYEAGTRDKYRLRAEPREDGGTELYLTHYGLKEVVATQVEEVVETAWVVRPSDPELANEVMNRLVLFLGGNKATAQAVVAKTVAEAPPRAMLEDGSLIVNEGFSRTWRRTGIALDKLGLVVDDRNRSQGLYYISKIDLMKGVEGESGSWFSGLFSSDSEDKAPLQRQIQLRGDEEQTRIAILDSNGKPDNSEVAQTILQRLQEALK